MYSLGQLLNGLRYPRAGVRELNRLYWDRAGSRSYNPGGVDVFEEDWDNLLILDGCRYDYYADLIPEYVDDGDLQSRISRGSATTEFLRGNFHERSLHDVVYVTASTMLYQEGTFKDAIDVELHDIVDVWSDNIDFGVDGVPPGPVARRARETTEKYPNKRMVVHFVQPHAPYIGPKGQETFPDFQTNPLAHRHLGHIDTSTDRLRELYEENLRLVLEEVADLIDHLPGRTVVSADHGMLLGEREWPLPIRSFGHPERVYVDEMITVPWHVIDNGPRKEIVAEPPVSSYESKRDDELDEKALELLEQLGYR